MLMCAVKGDKQHWKIVTYVVSSSDKFVKCLYGVFGTGAVVSTRCKPCSTRSSHCQKTRPPSTNYNSSQTQAAGVYRSAVAKMTTHRPFCCDDMFRFNMVYVISSSIFTRSSRAFLISIYSSYVSA